MERRKYLIKVLMVDSDIEFLNYERQIFDGLVSGEIFTALDGERAFEIFQEHNPDIILTDINLPLLNGFELISRIRESNSLIDNYIVVITENDNSSDEALALKLGANNYICKPIRPVKLISHFTSAVEMIYSVLELKFENYLLKQSSSKDVLTGLVNRDYLFKRCREEEFKAYRYKRNLSCMRLRFDGFVDILSDMGEKIAEGITKESATVFRENLRKSDIIGRIEDSEFGVLLPETNIFQAKSAGKKIQDMIANVDFISETKPVNMTVSIGISSNGSREVDEDGILKKAGEALSRTDSAGPNSIVLNPTV